jgi:primosomal protein N' (replication factor Y)
MPETKRIIQVAVPRPLHSVYDYHLEQEAPTPAVGARLRVPFGRSEVIGICVSTSVQTPHANTKAVLEVLDDDAAIAEELLDLAQWMSGYYHYPLGEVLATVLPSAARKGSVFEIKPAPPPDVWHLINAEGISPRAKTQKALVEHLQYTAQPQSGEALASAGFNRPMLRKLEDLGVVERKALETDATLAEPLPPTEEQRQAIDQVTDCKRFEVFLLEGVTGSGKTEVYLQSMAPVLAAGKQVLVLVPEIALTPQTLARFENRFGGTGMIHSALTDQQRLQTWLKCRAGEIRILIGTRSAVFTPFKKLGLIIVDEEHDSSYKQQEGLRYSARDLTVKRAQNLNVPLLLGSATPSLESLYNVQRSRYRYLTLSERAGGAVMPTYHTVDLRGQSLRGGFSDTLIRVIRAHLVKEGQILVYLNRRGFAPTLLCKSCGWQSVCPDCDAKLTLHRQPGQLICHHCNLRFALPDVCENCGEGDLVPLGIGTQRAEEALAELFPGVALYRIDRDTTRTNRKLNEQLERIQQGKPCIMVGTQMLAKGHHFPAVTLVAVVNADAGFLSPDFRAPERTAQLIVQVAGRAGRAQRPGEVWIQSYQPQNPLLQRLIDQGYAGFAHAELTSRIDAGLPPAQPMAMLRAEAFEPVMARDFLQQCKAHLDHACQELSTQEASVELLGPIPAPMARLAKRARFQLIIMATTRPLLHRVLAKLGQPKTHANLRWSIDVDPYDAM